MNGLRLWHGGGTAQVGRPKGPAHSIVSTPPSRCVKGRCGTSLRFVSSLGQRPPLTRLDCAELSSKRRSARLSA
jgi:hypothetical protein